MDQHSAFRGNSPVQEGRIETKFAGEHAQTTGGCKSLQEVERPSDKSTVARRLLFLRNREHRTRVNSALSLVHSSVTLRGTWHGSGIPWHVLPRNGSTRGFVVNVSMHESFTIVYIRQYSHLRQCVQVITSDPSAPHWRKSFSLRQRKWKKTKSCKQFLLPFPHGLRSDRCCN